jgi:hypothetical protein
MISGKPAHRFSMRRGTVASLGVTATVLACLVAGLPAAQATSDAHPSGTAAVFGDWTFSHYTEWTTDTTPPADRDGQAGEDNLANVTQVGELETKRVPGTTSAETTGWVRESPGAGWVQIDRKIVVDQAYVAPTDDAWTDQQWWNFNGNAKDFGPGNAPPADDGGWHANNGNPQSGNHAFESHTPDQPYFVDAGNGRADWFRWTATFVPGNPGQQELTHEEFRFELVTESQGHDEFRWEILERTNTPAEPEVENPSEPDVENPSEPEVENPTEPEVENQNDTEQLEQNGAAVSDTALNPNRPSVRSRAVPLSIDAGL